MNTRQTDETNPWQTWSRSILPGLLLAPAVAFFVVMVGCASDGAQEAAGKEVSFNLPKYVLQMQAKSAYAEAQRSILPKRAYVFPALRIDPEGRPLDALQHRTVLGGNLVWDSPAPRAAEVKSVVEQALRKRGFVIVGFESVLEASGGHQVLVVNPYLTRRLAVEDQESIKRVFVRLIGSTLPASIDPAGKIDWFNQEAIVFFDHELAVLDVAKRVLSTLVQNIGRNRQWQDRLHILASP